MNALMVDADGIKIEVAGDEKNNVTLTITFGEYESYEVDLSPETSFVLGQALMAIASKPDPKA